MTRLGEGLVSECQGLDMTRLEGVQEVGQEHYQDHLVQ
jgi:hypothetical protein